jgi:hypothetical protein
VRGRTAERLVDRVRSAEVLVTPEHLAAIAQVLSAGEPTETRQPTATASTDHSGSTESGHRTHLGAVQTRTERYLPYRKTDTS